MTTSNLLPGLPAALQGRLDALYQQVPSAQATIDELVTFLRSTSQIDEDSSMSQRKKRRYDGDDPRQALPDLIPSFTIADIAFTNPIRKKAKLVVYPDQTVLITTSVAPATASAPVKVEGAVVKLEGIPSAKENDQIEARFSAADVEHILCLSLPDKVKLTWCIVVLLRETDASIVLSLPHEGKPLPTIFPSGNAASTSWQQRLHKTKDNREMLLTALEEGLDQKTIHQDAAVFTSALWRKPVSTTSEPVVPRSSITAMLKNKEGILWLLPTGLFWGLKKPLRYLSSHLISDTSFHGGTAHNFNLRVELRSGDVLDFEAINNQELPRVQRYILHLGAGRAEPVTMAGRDGRSRAPGGRQTAASAPSNGLAAAAGLSLADALADESDDEAYAPSQSSSVPEDYDSSYDSDTGSQEGEAADGSGDDDTDEAEEAEEAPKVKAKKGQHDKAKKGRKPESKKESATVKEETRNAIKVKEEKEDATLVSSGSTTPDETKTVEGDIDIDLTEDTISAPSLKKESGIKRESSNATHSGVLVKEE